VISVISVISHKDSDVGITHRRSPHRNPVSGLNGIRILTWIWHRTDLSVNCTTDGVAGKPLSLTC